MEDRRFDSLVRSLASGANRRQILKGLLGLGGAALAGGKTLEAEAARRPSPTPKPPTCPGAQVPCGNDCCCPTGAKCGPACCPAGVSQCCDNACCYGVCYGEELCCPTGREYCAVTGECCPEGWRCCPDSGCIAPDQCCTAEDCDFQECLAAVCTAQHTCSYVDNCSAGETCCDAAECFRRDCQDNGTCSESVSDCRTGSDCCEAPTCYRSVCQENGACSEDIFDCRVHEDGQSCCTAEICSRSDCLENGSCTEPVPDCTTGDCCSLPEVCNRATHECCLPLTCEEVSEYNCGAEIPDGCGGTIDCSDNCDERLTCVNGGCVNTSATCYASACEDNVLGSCLTTGLCVTDLSGNLVCVDYVYPVGSFTGVCGDCVNNSACDPGDFCSADAGTIICPDCDPGKGTGCAHPASS